MRTPHDPADLMVIFQKKKKAVQEVASLQHTNSEEAAYAAATLVGEKAKHKLALIDLRKRTNNISKEYQQRMEDALASAHLRGAQVTISRTL